MKTLERDEEKIQQLCDALRHKTLEPAQREANEIIEGAKAEAEQIIRDAERKAEEIISGGRKEVERERSVLHSSLEQAGKQAIETLRQDIEDKLFGEGLEQLIQKGTSDSKVVAQLISSIVAALEKQGMAADLEALVPQDVSADSVIAELSGAAASKLSADSVKVGSFRGGAQLKIKGKRITVDVSDRALKELIGQYVRKDFREQMFGQ